ncbi:hypothetical protein HanIR_Chr04g0177111 [Helianthus annuus]|nr:hypothetical protein HanIR_Chr04g0177111 [Helianthus annuus]
MIIVLFGEYAILMIYIQLTHMKKRGEETNRTVEGSGCHTNRRNQERDFKRKKRFDSRKKPGSKD